jgi:hypothetical protein
VKEVALRKNLRIRLCKDMGETLLQGNLVSTQIARVKVKALNWSPQKKVHLKKMNTAVNMIQSVPQIHPSTSSVVNEGLSPSFQ